MNRSLRALPAVFLLAALAACGDGEQLLDVELVEEAEAPAQALSPTSVFDPDFVPSPKSADPAGPGGPQLAGAALGQPVPSWVIVSYNGLEWVWASPCALHGCTAGILVGKDGFGFATAAQWAARPPEPMFHGKCASPWFDLSYNHCDQVNLDPGPYSYNYQYGSAPTGGLPTANGLPMVGYGETLLVRGAVDATPPAVAFTLSGAAGDNGWYVGPVTVTWTVVDGESPITALSGCDPVTVSADGTGYAFTCSATSAGGTSVVTSDAFDLDQTPPTVTYSGNAGAYDVSAWIAIACDAADNLSGVATDTCAPASGQGWEFPLGTNTLSADATDNAGNTGSGSTSFEVTASFGGVCTLVQAFVSNAGVANSLCVKLQAAERAQARGQTAARDGALGAFINEVNAQSGNKVPADKAPVLVALAQALMS